MDSGYASFEYRIVTEESEVKQALIDLGNHDIYALDTETTGLDPRSNQIIGASIANQNLAFYFTKNALDPFLERLKKQASNPKKKFILHNAVFDLHFFAGKQVFFADNIIDTMIASFMVDENRSQALKSLAEHYLNLSVHLPSFKEMQKEAYELHKAEYKQALKEYRKINPAGGTALWAEDDPPKLRFNKADEVTAADIPLGEFGRYAALDARLTYDLWGKLEYLLEKEGVTEIFWEKEMPFIPVLFEMEQQGLGIDVEKTRELEVKYTEMLRVLQARIKSVVGEINVDSDQQLGKYLYETRGFPITLHTEKGAPSTNALALQRLVAKDSTGVVGDILEYRKYQKVLSTYVTPFLALADEQGVDQPRIYGKYNQTGTVTGRLSSSDPNLQNIPARHETGAEIRGLFIPRRGYTLVDADYSQLELRILAHYAADKEYIQLFKDGGDPHQMTADLLGVDRRIGKTLNFAWAYGAGPSKLCDTIEKEGNPRPNLNDAKSWIASFEQKRTALVSWGEKVKVYAKKLGYVRTIAGRKRHLPDIRSGDRSLVGRAERQSINTIIQGSASDIIKLASVDITRDFKKQKIDGYFVGQVHDELIFEIKDEIVEQVMPIIQYHMINAGVKLGITTPLEAKPTAGKTWKEAH